MSGRNDAKSGQRLLLIWKKREAQLHLALTPGAVTVSTTEPHKKKHTKHETLSDRTDVIICIPYFVRFDP